jgi:hypothetical protein
MLNHKAGPGRGDLEPPPTFQQIHAHQQKLVFAGQKQQENQARKAYEYAKLHRQLPEQIYANQQHAYAVRSLEENAQRRKHERDAATFHAKIYANQQHAYAVRSLEENAQRRQHERAAATFRAHQAPAPSFGAGSTTGPMFGSFLAQSQHQSAIGQSQGSLTPFGTATQSGFGSGSGAHPKTPFGTAPKSGAHPKTPFGTAPKSGDKSGLGTIPHRPVGTMPHSPGIEYNSTEMYGMPVQKPEQTVNMVNGRRPLFNEERVIRLPGPEHNKHKNMKESFPKYFLRPKLEYAELDMNKGASKSLRKNNKLSKSRRNQHKKSEKNRYVYKEIERLGRDPSINGESREVMEHQSGMRLTTPGFNRRSSWLAQEAYRLGIDPNTDIGLQRYMHGKPVPRPELPHDRENYSLTQTVQMGPYNHKSNYTTRPGYPVLKSGAGYPVLKPSPYISSGKTLSEQRSNAIDLADHPPTTGLGFLGINPDAPLPGNDEEL